MAHFIDNFLSKDKEQDRQSFIRAWNDQRAKEEEDDKFKNYLVEENERLNKINKTNEKIIEGLMEKLNKQT